jgi:hypothetical protein
MSRNHCWSDNDKEYRSTRKKKPSLSNTLSTQKSYIDWPVHIGFVADFQLKFLCTDCYSSLRNLFESVECIS